MTEALCAQGPQAGEDAQCEALYRQHHTWLQSWLHRKLGHTDDAADLAQDAFMRLLLKPVQGLEQPGRARAYLKAMANNMCVDMWRRREVEVVWLQTLATRPECYAPSPEQHCLVIEALLQVDRMLARLPVKAAQAFVLAQVHGMTYRAIGDELQVSERMVKKYMVQAMLQAALIEAGLA